VPSEAADDHFHLDAIEEGFHLFHLVAGIILKGRESKVVHALAMY
jgi:hypothetical protein